MLKSEHSAHADASNVLHSSLPTKVQPDSCSSDPSQGEDGECALAEDVKAQETEESQTTEHFATLKRLNQILAYSVERQNVLHRGCLLLNKQEAHDINEILKKRLGLGEWKFKEVGPEELHLSSKKSHKGDRQKSLGGANSHPSVKASSQGPNSFHPNRKSAASRLSVDDIKTSATSTQRVARITQAQLKHLPDWARRLHHILVLLCQTEAFKPFVNDISTSDPRYAEVCNAIQPGLLPIGLRTIISKLEQNGYQTALDVFNEIYSVWLCYYRLHPPSSPAWLQTYQASRALLQQIANQPIRDTAPTTSQVAGEPHHSESRRGETHKAQDDCRRRLGSKRPQRHPSSSGHRSSNVDELFKDFLSHRRKAPSRHNRQSDHAWDTTLHHHAPAHRTKTRVTPSHPAITDYERELFQSYLLKLQANHHLMLFEAFRKSAVWRSIEGGEVELDDTKTPAPIFRKMIAWCRSQLAVEFPHKKRLKLESGDVGMSAANLSQELSPNPESLSNSWMVGRSSDWGDTRASQGQYGGGKVSAQNIIGSYKNDLRQPLSKLSSTDSDDSSDEQDRLSSSGDEFEHLGSALNAGVSMFPNDQGQR